MRRPIPQPVIELVKEAEGLRLEAYPDPASGGAPWTIGYGHTGPEVRPGHVITKEQVEAWLASDLDAAAAIVDGAVKTPLTDLQRGVLASFVFNVGPGRKAKGKDAGKDGFLVLKSGKPSTMLVKLNAGDLAGAGAEFSKWVHGAGKVMPGLVTRRAAEAALFLSDVDHPTTSASPEPPPAPKPLAKSAANVDSSGALELAGVAVAIDQAREVSDAARGLLDSLPSGGLGWPVAILLAGAVAFLLYQRWADQRQAA
jgi:lysozyme